MKVLPYGMMALFMLAILVPTISFAESENEDNEMSGIQEQSNASPQQAQHEGEENEHSSGPANSGLVLLVTAASIVGVVGYSAWKVYKIRRKATSKKLV